eukprot:gnl/Spiro4/6243_TR3214_c0_g1_i1.p1 gnl/Spiro4/6243_TR3214_c0_g1~~gnl/Spiro4/6243_TR3214_c0_g1_i1.p1  ORF type:complete len:287 (+),score=-15.46 gnl/Spiro4/6243_TR3214_c0_g1_i1:28-861(+)
MANESTSFTRQTFAAPGTLKVGTGNSGGNMSWISGETTTLAKVSVNGEKIVLPLRPLAREVSYTSIELDRSQLTQQPIDTQQLTALNDVYQMNTDQMVYIGSDDVGATGLVNSAQVSSGNVANGVKGSPLWSEKTPTEILADVNTLLTSTWQASGFAVCPRKLLLPPTNFSYISSQLISSAGTVSILKYLKENSIALSINGAELDIQPVKWLTSRGSGNANRMVAYTNDLSRVRFPMVPIRRETAYYQGIRFTAPYVWAFGEVEFVYPETVRYGDGI